MRHIKYILILTTAAVMPLFYGCKLESADYNSINAGIFPKTEDDAKALNTANAYGVFMNNGYWGLFNIANGYLLVSDLMSDYGECTWRGWAPILYNRWSATGDWRLNKQWNYLDFMGKMTMNIDRIEHMNIEEQQKAKILADLHCARGWLAFCMYDLYGPVPIADIETLKKPIEERNLPRLSEEEMQKFIVTELEAAASVLPPSYKKGDANYGRFTKGLCNMILLKFYMQTKQWDKAVERGRELTKAEYGYQLMENYADIFKASNEKNAETIWAVNCLRGTQEHKWSAHVLPNDYPNTSHLTKWNGFKISWPFFKTFEENDQRLNTLIYEYKAPDGVLHNYENDTKEASRKLHYGAVPLKYDLTGILGENSETDWIIYRYADAVTLYAEALVRSSGQISEEALGWLNKVRTRAGLNAYAMTDFRDSRDFLDKLLLERGHELYFEGCRRQDLIRDGSYVNAIKEKCRLAGENTLVNEHYSRLPIPQAAITASKGEVKQNPGYTAAE